MFFINSYLVRYWDLKKVPMTFLAKIVACQSWPVVYLWQAKPTILVRVDVKTCKLHCCFYFILPFKKVQFKKGLRIQKLTTTTGKLWQGAISTRDISYNPFLSVINFLISILTCLLVCHKIGVNTSI